MKIKDLIKILNTYNQDDTVMILDGWNGGGTPREINLDTTQEINNQDAKDCADCENLVGRTVVVLGFGCY